MNYSRQRELILETLKEYAIHPNAEELYTQVHEKDKNISKGTLYRNLNRLAEEGIIKKIDGLDTTSHFDHNIHEHYHFICTKCGRIYDIEKGETKFPKIDVQKGFQVTSSDIILKGLCQNCNK